MVFLTFMLINTGISFAVAELGRYRRIGYTNLLFIGLLFSFAIALFVGLVSPSVEVVQETEYYDDPLEFNGKTAAERESMVMRYEKLLQLRRDGLMTDAEFIEEKNAIIRDWGG